MKRKRWMVLLLLCGVLLTACDRTEATQDTAGTTTVATTTTAASLTTNVTTAATTTVEEAVATTTATTTTTKPTVTPMENRTTVIPSTIAAKSTEAEMTTVVTTAMLPDKTRQLALYINGENLRLTFSSETTRNESVAYCYKGASSAGVTVECTVVPCENRIYDISCGLTGKVGDLLQQEEARDFLLDELVKMGFEVSEENLPFVWIIMDKCVPAVNPPYAQVRLDWSESEFLDVRAVKHKGTWCIQRIEARHRQKEPSFLTKYDDPYLIPNWV